MVVKFWISPQITLPYHFGRLLQDIEYGSYPSGVHAEWDGGKKTEDGSCQDQVVAAWVGVLDDSSVVELVVDDDENESQDDANNTDDNHGDVDSEGHSLNIWLNDCPILRNLSFRPPNQLVS